MKKKDKKVYAENNPKYEKLFKLHGLKAKHLKDNSGKWYERNFKCKILDIKLSMVIDTDRIMITINDSPYMDIYDKKFSVKKFHKVYHALMAWSSYE